MTAIETDTIRDLHCQGHTETSILAITGESRSNVRGVIKSLEKSFNETYGDELAACKMRMINGYERVMKEAWQGWVDSKQEDKVVKADCGHCAGSGDGVGDESCVHCRGHGSVVILRVSHPGDPRMLREINQSMAGIRQLLGADAPKRIEQKIDANVTIKSEENATDDELESIARGDFKFDEAGRAVVGSTAIALSATRSELAN